MFVNCLEKKYSVKTKVIAVDVTGGIEIYEKIRREIDGLSIGVLGSTWVSSVSV